MTATSVGARIPARHLWSDNRATSSRFLRICLICNARFRADANGALGLHHRKQCRRPSAVEPKDKDETRVSFFRERNVGERHDRPRRSANL